MAPRIMSTDKPKIIRLAVAGIALPIVFGVMIELACDSLKYVVHSVSSACYSCGGTEEAGGRAQS